MVFASPHSGRRYPVGFLAASRLDDRAIRRSEDAFVDELFTSATEFGAPLIRAHFPRAYVDVNRDGELHLTCMCMHMHLPNLLDFCHGTLA